MLPRPVSNDAAAKPKLPVRQRFTGTGSAVESDVLPTLNATHIVVAAVMTAYPPQANRQWSNRAKAIGPETSTPTPVPALTMV